MNIYEELEKKTKSTEKIILEMTEEEDDMPSGYGMLRLSLENKHNKRWIEISEVEEAIAKERSSAREELKKELCFFDREKGCPCKSCSTINSVMGEKQ